MPYLKALCLKVLVWEARRKASRIQANEKDNRLENHYLRRVVFCLSYLSRMCHTFRGRRLSMKQGSIYQKIFFSFSAIIIIYTTIILVTVINKEVSRQKYESMTEIEFYLEREASVIDSKFKTALDSTKILSENQSIKLLAEESQQGYPLYAQIFDQMKASLFSGDQLDYKVGITRGKDDIVVGLNGYFVFEDYLSFIGLENNDEIDGSFSKKELNQLTFFSFEQQIYLIRKMYIPEANDSLYFILNWNESAVYKSYNRYPSGAFYFVSDDDRGGLPTKMEDGFEVSHLVNQNGIGSQTLAKDTIFWKQSLSIPELYFVLIYPNNTISQVPIDTIWFILSLLFGLLALGLLLTFYFSRTSYRPYQKIISKIQQDSLNQNMNMDAILEKIETLKTTNYDLGQFKEESIDEIREIFLKNILRGKYPQSELRRMAPILGWEGLDQGGVVVVLTMNGKAVDEIQLSDKQLAKARKKILAYGALTDKSDVLIQSINYDQFVLIYLTKDQELIIQTITALRKILAQELSLNVEFVMSTPFYNLEELPNRLQDVVALSIETSFKNDNLAVQATLNKGMTYIYPVEIEQKLINLVKNKESQQARECLESILRTNLIERRLDTQNLADLKRGLLNTLKRLMQINNQEYSLFYQTHKKEFEKLLGTDQQMLYQLFQSIFSELLDQVATEEDSNHDVVKHVIDYIDKHYTKDLSLSDLATRFHLTESYLSKLIKESTGISFKTYLNLLKVNRAKELLAQRNQNVTEVAEEVGCKNVNTFIRIFKQHTGTTPGKYQNYLIED